MKSKRLLNGIGEIDEKYIAEAAPGAKKTARLAWTRWTAAAACLCLIVGGAVYLAGNRKAGSDVQQWSASISAGDYFRNSGSAQGGMSEAASLVMPPYAVKVSLDGLRGELEQDGVLPAMPEHPEQSFQTEYNGDGSLYKVTFLWMRRGNGRDDYSDLKLTVSPEELHELSDVNVIQPDSEGVTTTERDGILIYAEGGEKDGKTLSWQTEQGWYQITGSWNDSYADVIALLDWFWAHPLDIGRFDTPAQGTFVFSDRAEQPDAFGNQIPDFAALGYAAETEIVNLGLHFESVIPVWFDGVYTRGDTRIRWTVSIGADADAWAACLGQPDELTEEAVCAAISEKQSLNLFFFDQSTPCMATLLVEQGTGADAWQIVQTLQ